MFQLLFMNEGETVPYVKNVLPLLDESYDRILHSIMSDFSIEENRRNEYIDTYGYIHMALPACVPQRLAGLNRMIFRRCLQNCF